MIRLRPGRAGGRPGRPNRSAGACSGLPRGAPAGRHPGGASWGRQPGGRRGPQPRPVRGQPAEHRAAPVPPAVAAGVLQERRSARSKAGERGQGATPPPTASPGQSSRLPPRPPLHVLRPLGPPFITHCMPFPHHFQRATGTWRRTEGLRKRCARKHVMRCMHCRLCWVGTNLNRFRIPYCSTYGCCSTYGS